MRGLILAAALSAVAAPALAPGFILNSTQVKSGSPMSIAQAFTDCNGQNGIVNLAAGGMLVVSVARRLGSECPLLAYCAAPL
jgi:hypothetical protein